MHSLLKNASLGPATMTRSFQDHVVDVCFTSVDRLGAAAILKDPRDYVEALLAAHHSSLRLVDSIFESDVLFVTSVDKAFRVVVNDTSRHQQIRSAEVLARYCDMLLRKGATKLVASEVEVEDKLNKVVRTVSLYHLVRSRSRLPLQITLFKYLDEKDLFQKHFTRMFGRRLIQAASISEDAEANMIARLKVCKSVL